LNVLAIVSPSVLRGFSTEGHGSTGGSVLLGTGVAAILATGIPRLDLSSKEDVDG
jgi:hypothetical protein